VEPAQEERLGHQPELAGERELGEENVVGIWVVPM
jgi:hypothetical protein